jgi:DNA-binding transcriptional MocR family regulator
VSYQYQKLVQQIIQRIRSKQFSYGDKLPSIRAMAVSQGVSKTTVIKAYEQLEALGFINAVAKSGFYISRQSAAAVEQLSLRPQAKKPQLVHQDQLMLDIMQRGVAFDLLQNQSGYSFNAPLKQHLAKAMREQTGLEQQQYDSPRGYYPLREQIAKLYQTQGEAVDAEDVIITQGCQQSLLLALLACCKSGDTVAIESPAFYGVIEILRLLKLKVLELPCSSITGLDVGAFAAMSKRWPIKALVVTPNFSTPTGSMMPDENKHQLLQVCNEQDIVIIEDDIYRQLHFSAYEPSSLFSLAINQGFTNVISCSSFSKSLSRDLRIGWLIVKQYKEVLEPLKVAASLACSQSMQKGLANYLLSGAAKRYLNKRRADLQRFANEWQYYLMSEDSPFISCSVAKGGLSLWLEMPENIDAVELYNKMRLKGIFITPGALFSSYSGFNNFIRVSFSEPLDSSRKQALDELFKQIKKLSR